MLFTYPIDATNENWINETLLEQLGAEIQRIKQGEERVAFLEAIPQQYRGEFSRGTKFQELYDLFLDCCANLNQMELHLVLEALAGQNAFPNLFEVNTQCPSLANTLPNVHEAAKDLFEFAFKKLSTLKTPGSEQTVRSKYHECVHRHLKNGCCPFCGLEMLEAPDPDLVDPDLDHYLAVSKYPFAGANLRNLTAMGVTCNRSYKGAQDILLDEHDQRAECFDPYGNEQVAISLAGTVLLPGEGASPVWNLNFEPDAKSLNWRRVFRLETRLKTNVLEQNYQHWLKDCVIYAKRLGIDLEDRQGAIEAVAKFKITCQFEHLPTIAFLKMNFFDLVEEELADPESCDRMHNFMAAL